MTILFFGGLLRKVRTSSSLVNKAPLRHCGLRRDSIAEVTVDVKKFALISMPHRRHLSKLKHLIERRNNPIIILCLRCVVFAKLALAIFSFLVGSLHC